MRQKKPLIQGTSPLLLISSWSPLQILGVNFLELQNTKGYFGCIFYLPINFIATHKHILPACHMRENFILKFGITTEILYDHRNKFKRMNYLNSLQSCWASKIYTLQDTTAYHPKANTLTEHINQTLFFMLCISQKT